MHTQNRHSNKTNKRWSERFGTVMHHTLDYTLNALDMHPTDFYPKFGGTSEVQSVHMVRTVRDIHTAAHSHLPVLKVPPVATIHPRACGTAGDTCTSMHKIEGSIAEHCKLTYRSCHPSATVDPGSCPSRTAAAARARPISLQTIAIEAGSISGRGQGSRLQASDGSRACSARSPGAAPPLTMLARRGLHSGRRPAVDRGQAGRSSI